MRARVRKADEWLDKIYPVLNHGFVQIIDYMGDDEAIIQAARTTVGKSTKSPEEDEHTLRYMFRHKHNTPFEMCEVKLKARMPILVARQWVRHRTAVINEMSLRYSEAKDEFYIPDVEDICSQSKKNRQGRGEPFEKQAAENIQFYMDRSFTNDFDLYRKMVEEYDLSLESARAVLPVSLYTEWVWKINLHNLLHFLFLRIDPHAQKEIRVYAEVIANFVKDWVPQTWRAFEDYRLHAITFSTLEQEVLSDMIGCIPLENVTSIKRLKGRELEEFKVKLIKLLKAGE